MARRTNPLEPILSRIPAPLRNKYIITLIIFLLIMLFFNKINPLTQWNLQGTKEELQEKKAYYEKELEDVNLDRRDSRRDIEKFAREKYYMKKDNEDVFIIVDEEENLEK